MIIMRGVHIHVRRIVPRAQVYTHLRLEILKFVAMHMRVFASNPYQHAQY